MVTLLVCKPSELGRHITGNVLFRLSKIILFNYLLQIIGTSVVYVKLFLSRIVLELNARASPVKMNDCSFGEYILSLSLSLSVLGYGWFNPVYLSTALHCQSYM